jgi:hydrogenase large subunit
VSAERIVVDPVTRIEGHLRIEAERAADGRITGAWSSGTMVRGIELILQGRDPRDAWAFAQRICGVCTLVHGIASVRAVENALGYRIPPNAQLIRNLMIAAQFVHDHVMHFYHLHALDWVDVVSALSADPKATSELAQSISGYAKSSPGYFADTQTKLREFVESGQLGIFANGYYGHPGYRLPPEANLMAVAHYLEALEWQREVVQIHTIFGGKNPHPNFLVGGAPAPISNDPSAATGGAAATATNILACGRVRDIIGRMRAFVDQVYLPDTLAIASFYKDWFRRGEGLGNFMTYGDFPSEGLDDPTSWMVPAGAILDRDLSTDPRSGSERSQPDAGIRRRAPGTTTRAARTSACIPTTARPARLQRTAHRRTNSSTCRASYSWLKAPRWKGKAMEVGPLARVLMIYASGHEATRELAGAALRQLGLPLEGAVLDPGPHRRPHAGNQAHRRPDVVLAGTTCWTTSRPATWPCTTTELWDPSTWPGECKGVGFMEAPRGALAHYWIVIRDGRIDNYQAVVPSTWNAGPRDPSGQPGAYEAALMDNHELPIPEQPLEIQRTIHSFDPCIACAVHVTDPDGEELAQVQVT